MFKLEINKTGSTPYVYIDEERSYIRFQGESFPENVLEFYAETMEWLQAYLKTDCEGLTFDCELKYFNSSTAKMLLNILLMLDEAGGSGKEITVNWITTADNDMSIECGEDFSDEVENLTFNLVVHPV